MEKGIAGMAETVVSPDKTAVNMGSGDLAVYATPAVVALMEQACYESVAPYLDEGYSSVGVHMDIKHIAGTLPGRKVWAKSTLTDVEGRKLSFEVTAYDEDKCIAKAVHNRVIVEQAGFLAGLQ